MKNFENMTEVSSASTNEGAGDRTRARRNLYREILSSRLRVTLDEKEGLETPEDIKLLASLNTPPYN